jgi:serine/threonine-protein kinase
MVPSVPQLPAGLREGDLISGKYRIEAVLGAGAMGTVVSAYHVLLAERVAIKFLHPDRVAGSADAKARFIREAQAAIRVKSEHVARVLDIAALDTGDLYIVMEHLEGWDLAAWLRQYGPMPVEDAVDCIVQACEAIAEAHALGIVHRDLKPANLFLIQRGTGARKVLKVLDFGISKTMGIVPTTMDLLDGGGGAVTGASAMMGSPYYMSPEQMESARDVDGRTDIWALGVILCELVTGGLPFEGATLLEVYRKMISSTVPPLPGWPGQAPAALEAVICKCIARLPENRYSTARELAVALRPFASARGSALVERIRQQEISPAPRAVSASDPGRPQMEAVPRDGSEKTLPSRDYAAASVKPAAPVAERLGTSVGTSLRARRMAAVLSVSAIGVTLLIGGSVMRHRGAVPPQVQARLTGVAPPANSSVDQAQTVSVLPAANAARVDAPTTSPVAPSVTASQLRSSHDSQSAPSVAPPKRRVASVTTPAPTASTASPSAVRTAPSPNADAAPAPSGDELIELLRRRE